MPCSPVQVPPSAIARSDQTLDESLWHAFHLRRIVGIEQNGQVEIAVADMADDRRQQAALRRSRLVSRMHSASREIGTQTSVTKPLAPGRSASAA